MERSAIRAARRYELSLDRAGLALGAGAALSGLVVLLLAINGGQRDPVALASSWLAGGIVATLIMTAVGGPLWLVLHVAGLRRMRYAILVGIVAAAAIFTGAQTYGFGMFAMPAMDGRTLTFRWLSALSITAILCAIAAAIAAVMWRIAYRVRYELEVGPGLT